MKRRIVVPILFLLLFCYLLPAQETVPPSESELNAISERGRLLAEYDQAAWRASDAVVALNPPKGSINGYVAKKTGEDWTVCFGRLNDARDKYICVYEVTEPLTAKTARVTKLDPPREDDGFYLFAARALETARNDFKGEQRPYNFAVVPANPLQVYVYVVPAQTETGVLPLGGDVRYLISEGGSKIVERRQLHNSILEKRTPEAGVRTTGGFHTHVLSDLPEDTDVFHVLAQTPPVPEYVASKKYMYVIDTTGKITFLGETEKLLRNGEADKGKKDKGKKKE